MKNDKYLKNLLDYNKKETDEKFDKIEDKKNEKFTKT
jgi:hypothetical protein